MSKIIEKTSVDCFAIKAKALDLIRVFPHDIGKGQGRIIIHCYNQVWSAYWGGMGDRTIIEFFCSCDNDYLIGNLLPDNLRIKKINYDATIKKAKEHAKEEGIAFNAENLSEETYFFDSGSFIDEMSKIYGDWYEGCENVVYYNSDIVYLKRIIDAIKSAFAEGVK